jgi:hypothetical protein
MSIFGQEWEVSKYPAKTEKSHFLGQDWEVSKFPAKAKKSHFLGQKWEVSKIYRQNCEM